MIVVHNKQNADVHILGPFADVKGGPTRLFTKLFNRVPKIKTIARVPVLRSAKSPQYPLSIDVTVRTAKEARALQTAFVKITGVPSHHKRVRADQVAGLVAKLAALGFSSMTAMKFVRAEVSLFTQARTKMINYLESSGGGPPNMQMIQDELERQVRSYRNKRNLYYLQKLSLLGFLLPMDRIESVVSANGMFDKRLRKMLQHTINTYVQHLRQ